MAFLISDLPKNADKSFLEGFRTITKAAKTLPVIEASPKTADLFIENWQQLAEQALLTINVYGLKLLLDALRQLVKDYPQWQVILYRYESSLAWLGGDYQQAKNRFRQMRAIAQANQDFANLTQAQLELAEIALAEGRIAEAETLLERGLELSEAHGLKLRQAQLLNRLGRLYQLRLQTEVGQYYLKEALALLGNWNEPTQPVIKVEEAFAIQWLGASYSTERQWEKAEATLRQSLSLSYRLHDVLGIAETLLKLGAVYLQLEDYNSATICFDSSLAICQHRKYLPTLLQAYYYKALACYKLGQYQEALGPARQAVEIGLESEQWEWLARAFYNLGQVYQNLNTPHLALFCHLRAAELYQPDILLPRWIEILSGVGDFLLGLRDQPEHWQTALECYRKVVRLVEANEKLEYLAPVLGNMARAFCKVNGIGGLDDAARCYRLELKLAGDLDSTALPPSVAVALRVEALTGIQSCAALQMRKKQEILVMPPQFEENLAQCGR